MKSSLGLLVFFCLLGLGSAALPRIVIKGQRMFNPTTKDQFFCRGLAYAPTQASDTADPLNDIAALNRDLPRFKDLNVNCIRVYQFFASSNYTQAFKLLDDAGIYVILDIFDPKDNINRAAPSWNTELLLLNQAKIDRVSNFTNLLGIIVGNEVTNQVGNTEASAYVKAAIRDIKNYIKNVVKIAIPVGYAGADDADVIDNMQSYFVCGDSSTRPDFWGINLYRWCRNNNTFEDSKYQEIYNKYVGTYPIPTILTEFGCIVGQGRFRRNFTDVPVIFGPDMSDAFSGAIAYEYHTSGSSLRPEGNYGIADFNGNTATLTDEGINLAAQYKSVVDYKGSANFDQYTPAATTTPACPSYKKGVWNIAGSLLPPVADVNRCSCLNNQLQCRTTVQQTSAITPQYGTLIGAVASSICGNFPEFCANIASNATTGQIGPFSMCSSLIRASLLMNYVYQKTSRCEFGDDAAKAGFQEVVTSSPVASCKTRYPTDSAAIADVAVIDTKTSDVSLGDGEVNTYGASQATKVSGAITDGGNGNGGTKPSSGSSLAFSALLLVSALIANSL